VAKSIFRVLVSDQGCENGSGTSGWGSF